MEIPENILRERLQLLELGKAYPPSENIAMPTRLYSDDKPLELFISSTSSDRIPFSQAIELEYVKYDGRDLTPRWATFWFRFEVDVPQDDEWHLVWNCEGESLIYDIKGNPLQAFHSGSFYDRRASFRLTPGKKLYYIEVACNGLFGAGEYPSPDRPYKLIRSVIAKFDRKIWNLFWDFVVLKDVAYELKEEPIGKKALYIANKLVDIFYTADSDSLDQWKRQADQLLNHPTENLWSVIALGHCHIDTAWLWPYDETKRKCVRSWATQIALMEDYETYRFGASAALHYEWVLQYAPGLFEKIQKRVAEGRWEILGGSWVEFDGNVPSGESMTRQFYYGQRFFKKHFGKYCDVFFLPDTFGYSAQLPQIMKQAGLNYFITQKLSWNNINKFPHHTFYWRGLDGTQVLTHFPPANTYNSNGRASDIIKSIKDYKQNSKSEKSLLLFGLGDGGGGPLPMNLESILRLNKVPSLPAVTFEPLSAVFENPSADLPVWYGELYFELHRGTYTTAKELKKLNRAIEGKLRTLEILNTFNQRVSTDRVDELWVKILQHQFHDVLPGSSVKEVYDEVIPKCREMVKEIDELIAENEMYGKVNIENSYVYVPVDDVSVKVYRPFSLKHDVCQVSEVKILQHEDSISLENDFFVVKIDNAGQIEMHSKDSNREVFNKKGHIFCIYDDIPLYWDAWDVEIYHLTTRRPVLQKTSIELSDVSVHKVTLTWSASISASSSIKCTFRVFSYLPYLDVETCVDWHENHKLLKIEFPIDISYSSVANYDIQFGHLSRPTHFNTSWDVAKFEVCGHRWVDLSEHNFGVALLNDSCYGFEVHEGKIAMSMLRSPYAPDPDMDRGQHVFRYGVYPHVGSLQYAKVPLYASYLNSLSRYVDIQDWWVEKDNDAVFIEALKESERGVVVRLCERFGGRQLVKVKFNIEKFGQPREIWRCDVMERDIEKLGKGFEIIGDDFEVVLRPFEVSSFKVYFN